MATATPNKGPARFALGYHIVPKRLMVENQMVRSIDLPSLGPEPRKDPPAALR